MQELSSYQLTTVVKEK